MKALRLTIEWCTHGCDTSY